MNSSTESKLLSQQSLRRLFGEMNDEQLETILSFTNILEFKTGEYVFQQGGRGHSFYIVLSGRFRAMQKKEEGIFILGDISAGEPIGEISLFTREPHSASVMALRKSSLLQLDDAAYLQLVQQFPSFANSITRFIIERLKRNAHQTKMDAAPKNIAVVNLQPSNDVSEYTAAIEQQLLTMGFAINIYDHQSYTEDDTHSRFDDMEKYAGLNFLVCDIEHPGWARQCIAYCDLVIIATDFKAESPLYSIEKELGLYSGNELNRKMYLLLLHEEDAALPYDTGRWLKDRPVALHLHLRKRNAADTRRFCRIITHQAVGLVLGGGGARGFAHIGAARALMEQGIEFDFIGGTSAGAVYGAGLSYFDFNYEQIQSVCKKAGESKLTSNDLTLPVVSLMSGKKIRKFLSEMYSDSHLEDLWVNTYCVSTDFSNATLKVHESGLTSQQVAASMAIPGVFPPVIINRHLHIDGGVIDNLPVEAMYKKPVRHIIAVSLSAEDSPEIDLPEIPSSWNLFWNKLTNADGHQLPGLSSILVNSITINSRHRQESSKPHVSVFLELDLKEFKFLDWENWQQLIEKGYAQTKQQIETTALAAQFWK
ncbi:cyclic nucleotide-binding domain-containing protein [Lacibacter luteus]|uniref:Cyclic nucleotide-binding domain-containing protein n=1 Tax=Lacibacter luteus TaxID=2508719 RepID=A0A4Q1CES9_9BACT|nr:patatin-like phospholipase family protein [Lacibacter luteus]RXK58098.1 cyclic nucleotide-binding domain-containing protein [Lacibacter luteus]